MLMNNWKRIFLGVLLVSSFALGSAGPALAQTRRTAVVFSVSSESGESGEGNMDAVVMVDGKRLRAPYSDEQKDRQKSFGNWVR